MVAADMPDRIGRDAPALVILCAVFLLPPLATRDLWEPDAPRYMEVAREMVVLDNYLAPHLNGEVYSDKPPMFFWLTALLYRLGVGIKAGRVVAALAATGTVLATYFFARRLLRAPGPLLAVALVVAWLAPACMRGGAAYTENILVKQTAGRLARSYSHRRPFYYYLAKSVGLFAPWSLLFGLALASAWKAWRMSRESASAVGLAWFVGVFVFFSRVSGKRTGYLMPLMPAFGLLMGRYLALGIRRDFSWPSVLRDLLWVTIGIFALIAVGGIAVVQNPIALARALDLPNAETREVVVVVERLRPWIVLSGIVGLLLAASAWWQTACRGRHAWMPAAMTALLLWLSLTVGLLILPVANVIQSPRNLTVSARPIIESSDRLFVYPTNFRGAFNFYLGSPAIPVLSDVDALTKALASPRNVAAIARERDLQRAVGLPPRIGTVAAARRVGRRKIRLVMNWLGDGR